MEKETKVKQSNRCSICNGLLYGEKVEYTGDFYCKCNKIFDYKDSLPPAQVGWICPVCGAGLSPFTMMCPCKTNFTIGFNCKIDTQSI